MEQQQGIRRRFTHILTYSIGMCRSKHTAESPSRVSSAPVSLPSRLRKPRLADLFSADSDTISSTTRCEKFNSDKTWSGSEADRASMSHLSPFEYETCDGEFDDAPRRKNDTKLQFKTTAFEPDYYRRKSCSSSSRRKRQDQRRNRNYSSADARSDSDIASSLLMELSNSRKFPESSVCSNEPEPEIQTHKNAVAVTRASGKSRPRRMRRKESEVGVKAGSMAVSKRSVDPYEDFRRSMVEMIVEKEIFGREELEELLMSFLALNSADHHKIIVLVFVEILEIVFSNSSSSSR
ncbi:hypothetical protein QQ045_002982 [Rhodiola kirilowii]